jgi:hypothetical protein
MLQNKTTENRPLIQSQSTKPQDKKPDNHGFKVRTNVPAGRHCWFIPIGPMGDGCLMCDDGSQYC